MKAYKYSLALLFISLVLALAGCKKDKDTPTPIQYQPLQLQQNEITLKVGEEVAIGVTGGSGRLNTSIANVGVATAKINKDGSILVQGHTPGKEILVIEDVISKEKSEIHITITEEIRLTVTPNAALLFPTTSKVFHIKGGSGKYSIASKDNNVVTCSEQVGDKFVLFAGGYGSTEVEVQDQIHNLSITVPISVELRPFILENKELSLSNGDKTRLIITSGNGEYEINTQSSGIVKANIIDGSVLIEGLSPGNETISVKDVLRNESIDVSITVTPRDLVILTTDVIMPKDNGSFYLAIHDGNGNYSVEVTDGTDIVSAEITDTNLIHITSSGEGTGTIKVIDLYTQQEEVVKVTARELKQHPAFDKSEATIKVGEQVSIALDTNQFNYWEYYYLRAVTDRTIISVQTTNQPQRWYQITGLKPGSTILRIDDGYEGELYAEILITVLP